jgi:hypothetical protein
VSRFLVFLTIKSYVFLLKEYKIAKQAGTGSVVYVLMAWLREPISQYTVSWRIRIFNCIEEVPRFFFPIEFNSAFQISNYLQFNCTPDTV